MSEFPWGCSGDISSRGLRGERAELCRAAKNAGETGGSMSCIEGDTLSPGSPFGRYEGLCICKIRNLY